MQRYKFFPHIQKTANQKCVSAVAVVRNRRDAEQWKRRGEDATPNWGLFVVSFQQFHFFIFNQ